MISFWRKKKWFNYLLLPAALVWQAVTFLRLKKKGYVAKSLVICIGNIVVGGAGKTPFTMYLAKKLMGRGLRVAIISRGYKSKNKECLPVNIEEHTARDVGDEALLLARVAKVVVSPDRKEGVRYLEQQGFDVILMDDGMQNPGVVKDMTILMLDGLNPLGNGLIIPAGPLREPLKSAEKRTDFAVITGANAEKAAEVMANYKGRACFAKVVGKEAGAGAKEFSLAPAPASNRVFAFAGIGNPEKFYVTLKQHGINVVKTKDYPDHYNYKNADIEALIKEAQVRGLRLITTSKDYVKISPEYYPYISEFAIELQLDESCEAAILRAIEQKLAGGK